jgi:hypothetical protein
MKALESDTNKRKGLFMDSSIITLLVIGVIVVLLLIVLSSAIRVVQQYERGVIFVLGRLIGQKDQAYSWSHPLSHAWPKSICGL